ncbi:MAG: hypothetical protein GYB65_02525 [Chloroflexi bacterium]|nr:hypothetical protein [Chloroflexota bacterium]
MSIDVFWDDENHTIIRWFFPETFDWDQYQQTSDQAQIMLATIEHHVWSIMDIHAVKSLPPNFLAN